jgi:hypothetical protein
MKRQYLAVVNLAEVPDKLLPVTALSIGNFVDLRDWRASAFDRIDFERRVSWVLERDGEAPPPVSRHECCMIQNTGIVGTAAQGAMWGEALYRAAGLVP